jgi:redox-sensitive bicupin YhaK (pirin superfamily)
MHCSYSRDSRRGSASKRALLLRRTETLLAGTTLTHAPIRYRHSYLAPAQGVIIVNGQLVAGGDGITAINEPQLTITAEENAEFILVDAA